MEEFQNLDLENRMKIMKFYASAKNRWKKLYNKELSLEKYLSWLISPDKDLEIDELDPTSEKNNGSSGVDVSKEVEE